ncbi:MAG: phosphate transport system ATP-binding protein [Alphaproteobacteria bacterium]|nr:phosphate transport system ATP-binding protein [Alphaproteobacteria bacterium]
MNVVSASVAVPTVTHAPISTVGLPEKVTIRNLNFYYGASKALKDISRPLYQN